MTNSVAAHVVVFDTNVLIPLLIPASRSSRLFLRLQAAACEIAVTPQILQEVEEKLATKEKLRKWLRVSDEQISQFIDNLRVQCQLLAGTRRADGAVPADPTDDKILAAAREANADYVVSEDRHLLDIGVYCGVTILTRDQMQAELDRLGVGT